MKSIKTMANKMHKVCRQSARKAALLSLEKQMMQNQSIGTRASVSEKDRSKHTNHPAEEYVKIVAAENKPTAIPLVNSKTYIEFTAEK